MHIKSENASKSTKYVFPLIDMKWHASMFRETKAVMLALSVKQCMKFTGSLSNMIKRAVNKLILSIWIVMYIYW